MALVFSALQECKDIYEDVQFSNEKCKELLKRCLDVSYPVNQINDNKDLLLNSNSAALSSALTLLIDCRNFCNKYKKRSLFNTITHHNRDKENFVDFNRRLDSTVASFNLQVRVKVHLCVLHNFTQRIFVSKQLTAALTINMAEIERRAKADREFTIQMLMQLLEASGQRKEFMRLPENEQKRFAERARMMSSNLMDLSQMDLDDLDQAHSPTPSKKMAGGTSRQTKLSVLNSLVQDIDFALLKYWDPNNPTRVDPTRVLGQGSFGVVYRCEYGGKEIALKHFSCLTDTKVRPTARELRLIQKEACTLQYCATHRNVIGFYGVSMEKGILLMELAVCSLFDLTYGGKDLTATLPRGIDIAYLESFSYKASVVHDIASALYFLHFHNIMHRDIKSCNVVMVPEPVTTSGSVSPRQTFALVPKLSDFGLATAVGTSTNTNSSGNSAVGSTPYMAPEILVYTTPQPVYTPAVDIYALGVLANEIFTREVPWKGCKEGQIIAQVCFQQARPPAFAPPVTDLLAYRVAQDVIGSATRGCLHQDPLKRPTSRHLSYDTDILRQAAVPVVSAARRHPVENAAQAAFSPAKMEDKKFKDMVFSLYDSSKQVSERAGFFHELNVKFPEELMNFEVFACEAIDVLEELRYDHAADVLVTQVLAPLHQVTLQYVTDKLSKGQVYQTEPSLLLQEIECMDDAKIFRLMNTMGPVVTKLHTGLNDAAQKGSITDDEHSMRIPPLVRTMLRMHALAAVCEPRCCLLPAPGAHIQYQLNTHLEILGPGVKHHGQVKVGDAVQVVRSGLYKAEENDTTTLAGRPLYASMVRRLLLTRVNSRYMISQSDIRVEFEKCFVDFESFAFDAVDILEDLAHTSNANATTDLFVTTIMSPIHQVTQRYVTDKLKEPRYTAQPNQMLLDINDLEDSVIFGLMNKMGPKVPELCKAMSSAAAKGVISDDEHTLKIPMLVRHMLKAHAMAALSDPKCELLPVPGYHLPYRASHHKEILSPGAKHHGHINEGDMVEVVLCGVNFEMESSDPEQRPAISCLVRRLLHCATQDTSSSSRADTGTNTGSGFNSSGAASDNNSSSSSSGGVSVSQVDVKTEFVAAFQNLDPFSNDAVNCLEDLMGHDNAADLFVEQIMRPLFRYTQTYVSEKMNCQSLSLQEIEKLDDDAVEVILESFGPLASGLHNTMLEAAETNFIDSGDQHLRLPGLVRVMLKLHAMAALSEPCCYLQPAPGVRQCYRDGHHAEVLSPGSKRHGRIQDGDQVEVVLCGLYFEAPTNTNTASDVRPIVPCMVRRLL